MGRFSRTLKLGLELEQFNVKVTLTQQLCATAVMVDSWIRQSHTHGSGMTSSLYRV
jgi:hypothetical protein